MTDVTFSADAYITGDPLHRFQISSGKLFLRRPLLLADKFSVQLRRTSFNHEAVTLNISVESSSVIWPSFQYASIRVRVMENAGKGTSMVDVNKYLVHCQDCLFSVASSLFKVDSKLGIIVTDSKLKFGTNIQFDVIARKLC